MHGLRDMEKIVERTLIPEGSAGLGRPNDMAGLGFLRDEMHGMEDNDTSLCCDCL